MANSLYFPPAPRGSALRQKGRNGHLPSFSSAVHEKLHQQGHPLPWIIPISLPIPGVRNRKLRLLVFNPSRLHQFSVARFGRRRGQFVLFLGLFLFLFVVFALTKRFATRTKQWPTLTPGEPSTLVFRRQDLQRIWKWEIASGHYPSRREIPEAIGFTSMPFNPAVPPLGDEIPARYRPPPGPVKTATIGVGPKRTYLDIQSQPPDTAYPPRPFPNSVADLDIIMKHCDFSQQKYVRDCLEVLRVGGGLDNGRRTRRAKVNDWQYIYTVTGSAENITEAPSHIRAPDPVRGFGFRGDTDSDTEVGLTKKRGADLEADLYLPPPVHHEITPESPCDTENPRLFHMFWTGPFTDKPYLALLSFLYTQNLGLHMKEYPTNSTVCRPQFWLWINPGPAAAVPNPSAMRDMFEQLKNNPWASPFLHPRFHDVIQFKLWNTTEQLDGVPEIRDEWREFQEVLFNSGGHIINVPADKLREQETTETSSTQVDEGNVTAQAIVSPTGAKKSKGDEDDLLNRTGSKSSSSYDRLSVILSDLARFILCHRFGGIYMDVDNIFLRDWEELWGWNGAFAYRWSRLEKYNTAVLRMNKGSAVGSFLFRTALKNAMDFHPMTVSRYTKDAYLEGLLLRLPDALFDSAWLNTEYYQRDRPPQPYFHQFSDFFDTPTQESAAPQALGFDGFFKGAYSYHFHNFWWKPFDPSRNWPDLGPRFTAGERTARILAAKDDESVLDRAERLSDDKRDLDWATVLKRTFEAYIRGERPNMYGEWLVW